MAEDPRIKRTLFGFVGYLIVIAAHVRVETEIADRRSRNGGHDAQYVALHILVRRGWSSRTTAPRETGKARR